MALLLGCFSLLWAQKKNVVAWEVAPDPVKAAPGGAFRLKLTAKIDPEWHMYSLTTPKGGGLPAVVNLAPNQFATQSKIYQPKPESKFDPNFGVNTERYEGEVVFYLDGQVAKDVPAGPLPLTVNIRYSACTDKLCNPPRKLTADTTLTVEQGSAATPAALPASYVAATAALPVSPSKSLPRSQKAEGLGAFLLVAFGAGLAAIFTPCVFPMIPITLSFFLGGGSATRGQAMKQAAVFCLGIVFMFTLLGFAVSAVVGPFGVVQLAANPWVNAFISIVFLAFGLSLLGAFEITLPSALVNRLDSASRRGGIGGTLLMGLTFSLTSFACVGPFVGTLLAASVQQGGIQPVLGMITFAAGLASPFFLLALFPSYLQRMPRSGGWLVRVKVVLGFIVLAVMFKYLSSIDSVLQLGWLTRERFLAVWVVLFALPGLYLLGLLRMEGIDNNEPVGVKRALIGAAFLIFSFSLIPGMFGRPLGELDAYVPLATGSSGSSESAGAGLPWMKNQYKEALEKARQENKLVLVSFTGYACTNCHWMKANMFTRPEVADALKNFVLVELYTDGTDSVSEENQKLQESKFQTISIPFYAIMTPDEKAVASWAGIQRSAPDFLAFLASK